MMKMSTTINKHPHPWNKRSLGQQCNFFVFFAYGSTLSQKKRSFQQVAENSIQDVGALELDFM